VLKTKNDVAQKGEQHLEIQKITQLSNLYYDSFHKIIGETYRQIPGCLKRSNAICLVIKY